ncbi:MAG: TlpA family protein disulfide reductase [Holophagales bacterium]|nr:TlpA family protein disulfide reductase [Holophagales bacterium]MYH25436.1 TlpA family protein disulfide reductase [Holophagales bacterium]
MNRRHLALATVIVAVLAPLGGLLWFESGIRARQAQRPEVGALFPALPGLADGETLPGSPGRPRVVTFARAGCGNCDRTITALRRLARSEGPTFDLIAVVAGSDSPELDGDGIHAAIADPDGAVSRRFGVVHVPLVFLVDGQSRILAVTTGERPETAWRSFLESGPDAL